MVLHVKHVTACFMFPHGPSTALLAQLASEDRSRVRASIWGMYAPRPEFDATEVARKIGVDYTCLGMGRSFLDVRVLPRMVSALNRERPDIIQGHLVRANVYSRFAARLAHRPKVVCTMHGVDTSLLRQGVSGRSVHVVESATVPMVDAYVAVSQALRRMAIDVLNVPPEKVQTIYNAIDLDLYCRTERDDERRPLTIGAVGSLDPNKNHALLLRAARNFPNVRIAVAGEGAERENLLALARELGMQDRVTLAGFSRDIPGFLASVDIFAMTSVHEGLPLAVAEAMASGLPVVATDAGGTAEAIVEGTTGFVVPIGDEELLGARLKLFVENADLRRRAGAAGRARAIELYSPSRVAAQYAELYERVTAGSGTMRRE